MFQFTIPDMTCGNCARHVSEAIHSVDPAAVIATDPPARDVKVTTGADKQAIIAALTQAGYPPAI